MESFSGRILGDYEVGGLLGRGAMATVYEARDRKTGDKVALKIPHEEMWKEKEYLRRFEEEGKTAMTVRHPNVVRTLAVSVEPPKVYIAMEIALGRTLAAAVKRDGPFPPKRALGVAEQLADALVWIHRYKIVHRDIKPANVILMAGDRALLTDFGIARSNRFSGGRREDSEEEWAGTPAYASPEQVRRTGSTEKSDIYSLGVVLWEMLAGRAPFEAEDVGELTRQVLESPAPDITRFNPKVPETVQILLDMAMAKDPADRHAHAEELLEELRAARSELGG